MSSTFGTLNTAFTALTAARQGIGVAGQNIANVGTQGYTRQRAETTASAALAQTGLVTLAAPTPGQGVSVDGISRLGNVFADARVRTASADSGYANARAEAMHSLETSLREPGDLGLSSDLQNFWAGWQELANRAGDDAPTAVLLETSAGLVQRIGQSYTDVENLWAGNRAQLESQATELNAAAERTAALNERIRSALNQGGSANELIDERSVVAEGIAALAGGTVRHNPDGTLNVYVGGNALVQGTSALQVKVVGALQLGDAPSPSLEFVHRPGAIAVDGGSIAGTMTLLAPDGGDGSGGILNRAAAFYNGLATALAAQVNAVHSAGMTPDGATGLDFFGFAAGVPAAKGLTVLPTGVDTVATGTAGAGALDGSNADKIAQISTAAGSPDRLWATFVGSVGATARADLQHAALADMSRSAATSAQQAGASVSLDEENVSLVAMQHAYQAAARVMTAVDQMLDTLINRTGLVGR